MGKCKLCREEIRGMSLTCSMGTICQKCSNDVEDAGMQPARNYAAILWTLAETFFRKGKGERITFEEVWKNNSDMKLVKFEDLYRIQEVEK